MAAGQHVMRGITHVVFQALSLIGMECYVEVSIILYSGTHKGGGVR